MFSYTTTNPLTRPLPHPHLLQLHAAVMRVCRAAGIVVEEEGLDSSEGEDSQPGPLSEREVDPTYITGAYHGASHQELGWIAAVEPLQSRLDHISISWAARSLRTGDKEIREFLEDKVTSGYT